MNKNNEPADIIELCDTVEDLANAMAAVNDGYVDVFELKRNVVLTLGERFQMRMMARLEKQCQVCAFYAMRMHEAEMQLAKAQAQLAEEKAEIRRKRTDEGRGAS